MGPMISIFNWCDLRRLVTRTCIKSRSMPIVSAPHTITEGVLLFVILYPTAPLEAKYSTLKEFYKIGHSFPQLSNGLPVGHICVRSFWCVYPHSAGGQFKSGRLLCNIERGTHNPSADNSFADDPSSLWFSTSTRYLVSRNNIKMASTRDSHSYAVRYTLKYNGASSDYCPLQCDECRLRKSRVSIFLSTYYVLAGI